MKALLAGALLIAFATSSAAEEVSAETQVKLQSAMQVYMNSRLSAEGGMSIVDLGSGTFKTIYQANVHPFVVTAGDYYFLCSEMVDEEGKTLTADYLMRDVGGEYQVLQLIVDNRASVASAVKKFGK